MDPRYWEDIAVGFEAPKAAEALVQIHQLYRIEREIRGRSAEERRIERQTRAGPILDALHSWLIDTLARTSKKRTLGVALQYPPNSMCALRAE
jgi:transposase